MSLVTEWMWTAGYVQHLIISFVLMGKCLILYILVKCEQCCTFFETPAVAIGNHQCRQINQIPISKWHHPQRDVQWLIGSLFQGFRPGRSWLMFSNNRLMKYLFSFCTSALCFYPMVHLLFRKSVFVLHDVIDLRLAGRPLLMPPYISPYTSVSLRSILTVNLVTA